MPAHIRSADSAGQAAAHLAKFARQVILLVRGDSLATTMSDYLIKEIDANDRIDVRTGVEVVGGTGESRLASITIQDKESGRLYDEPADGLFVLIGAVPDDSWLPEEVARDRWGYLLTGADVATVDSWKLERPPHPFETSLPGVFAVGDVRHGSVKRVASAVGEGSVAVQSVHLYLQEGQ
jgi:thioredoxin reductase (NADPH)